MEKKDYVKIRISSIQKENWKKVCAEKKISLTSLMINSVENRIMDNERREVFNFIERQVNIFTKIETNINQVAKMVNGQKFISESQLQLFSEQLSEMVKLKAKQNKIFECIYELLSK